MENNSALNKHIKESSLFKRRAIAALIVAFIFSGLLLIRLTYLQVFQHQFYSTLSRQNLLSIIPVGPSRGLIYDRNGILLAKNMPVYSLDIIPEKIKKIPDTIQALQKYVSINDDDIKQFNRIRNQYRQFEPIPLKMKLGEAEIARFYVNQHLFPGVIIQARETRFYPMKDLISEVVGYVGRINQNDLLTLDNNNYDASDDIGKNGIEKYYEKDLHGVVGSEQAEINATGHVVRILKRIPPQAGKNVYLTIDSRLQAKAHELLANENGSVVIMQPNNGEVLALVSHPSFDPNLFVRGISQTDYQNLLKSPDHPLFNRVTQGQFPAASTVKPFIALSALNDGVINTNYRIFDPGWFQLPNVQHIYHDWKRWGHGWVNISRAIEVSCDTFFWTLSSQMGIEQLSDDLMQFGFGQKTNIDLPNEQLGLVPTPEWKRKAQAARWFTGDTILTGIGQGFMLATPIQLAQATAVLANQGKSYVPHLLLKTVDENGGAQYTQPLLNPALHFNPNAWQVVSEAMQAVINSREGTAHYFGIHAGYTIAGKTGTAQVYGHNRDEDNDNLNLPKQLRNNHLFIAFAPVENPQVVIAIVIEHSAKADKIAGQLINYYFELNHHD